MSGVTTYYQTGVHASRPANGAGCVLYSCTTHGLIYRDDGTTWTTFLTLSTSGMTNPMTTAGDIIVGGASGAPTRLAGSGTDGYVATYDSTTTPKVKWAAAAGGGGGALVLLQTQTASASAQLDFATSITATYDEYMIEIVNIVPATDSVAFNMRFGTGGGPTYDTGANYGASHFTFRTGASGVGGADSGQTAIQLHFNNTINNTAAYSVNGSLKLFGPASGAHTVIDGMVTARASGISPIGTLVMGRYLSTTAVTALRFYFSSGNIASGTIRVYGIAKT